MQDMKKHYVDANIVTYSTIIKGHCQAGEIQRAFAVLKEMKQETHLKPDEIMYNSLLDGCAQNSLFEEGQELLKQMLQAGIAPSNFTLSIMVKMLNRARKIEQAFALVVEITTQYKFKPNIHVYTNLMQGCIGNRQLGRAMTVLENMIKERVQPDCRVYSVLIRACFYQDSYEQAASLLRTALGLPGAMDLDKKVATCYWIDSAFVNETLATLAERGCGKSLAAPVLADIKKCKVQVNIDQAIQRRVLSALDETPTSSLGSAKGSSKGKGKGKGAQRSSW